MDNEVLSLQQRSVQLLIAASDGGSPPLSAEVAMDVEITQTINEYPQWIRDYSAGPPIRIPESVPVNFEVGRFRATSTVPDASLNYFIARGDTPEQNGQPISFYSRLDERTNEMVLLTYRPLDYETLSRYTLTVKAAVGLYITVSCIIILHRPWEPVNMLINDNSNNKPTVYKA